MSECICYKRFKGHAICGDVNIPHGTIVTEQDGMLYWKDNPVCLSTSENGWEHFRPDTFEAAHRQEILNGLYAYYLKHGIGDDLAKEQNAPGMGNRYWKNLLRTAPTKRIEELYERRCGNV